MFNVLTYLFTWHTTIYDSTKFPSYASVSYSLMFEVSVYVHAKT